MNFVADKYFLNRLPVYFSDGNSFTTLIIILAILFALLLIGGLLWYWWKYCRKKENEKPNREVTLVNMNTKSESGEGKRILFLHGLVKHTILNINKCLAANKTGLLFRIWLDRFT